MCCASHSASSTLSIWSRWASCSASSLSRLAWCSASSVTVTTAGSASRRDERTTRNPHLARSRGALRFVRRLLQAVLDAELLGLGPTGGRPPRGTRSRRPWRAGRHGLGGFVLDGRALHCLRYSPARPVLAVLGCDRGLRKHAAIDRTHALFDCHGPPTPISDRHNS